MSAAIHLLQQDSKKLHAYQHCDLVCLSSELELPNHVQPTAMHPALQAISLLRYV